MALTGWGKLRAQGSNEQGVTTTLNLNQLSHSQPKDHTSKFIHHHSHNQPNA